MTAAATQDNSLEIAGALARFWSGGAGPSRARISTAIASAGVVEPSGEMNKEQLVLAACRIANPTTERRLFEELLTALRAAGALNNPERAEVRGLAKAFSRGGHSLDSDGFPTWATDVSVNSPAEPPTNPTQLSLLQACYLKEVLGVFREHCSWPSLSVVQRSMIRRLRETVDVVEVAQSLIPMDERPPFLSITHDAALGVRELVLAEADEEVGDFLLALKLAVTKFFDEEAPTLSSDNLTEGRDLTEERLRRLEAVLQREPNIVAGGGSTPDPYRWEYVVSDQAHLFQAVGTIADYLAVKTEIARGATPRRSSPPRSRASAPDVPSTSLTSLHPSIQAAAGSLFASGHHGQAVFEAYKAIEERVRAGTGLHSIGKKLMGEAFGGKSPRVQLSTRDGISGKDEQEGFGLIFMGASMGIRNPRGHEVIDREDPQVAHEFLSLASVLMRLLDTGTFTDLE